MAGIRSTLKNLVLMVVVGVVYAIAGKLGLRLAFVHASASPVWPATGITLAVFLVLGYRFWPAIFLAAFFVNATTAGNVFTSLGIASGNTLEGLAGAYLANRFAAGRKVFNRAQDIFKFSLLAGMLSTTISATIGVSSLEFSRFARWSDYSSIWLTWWLGDMAGNFVVAPFLILWAEDYRLEWKKQRIPEVITLLFFLVLTGQIVFGGATPASIHNYPIAFTCIPILIWISFKFTQREAATAVILLSVIATFGTLRGFGPFITSSQNVSLLLLQAFMAVISVMSITLASVASENRRAYEDLEARIEKRTLELREYIDSMSTLTAKIGLDGKLILVNKIARVASGMHYQELMNTNFLDGPWWSFDASVQTRVRQAFQRAVLGTTINYDEKVRLGTGEIIIINFSLVPVRDADRNVKYILAEGRNITPQKEAEAALKQSERRTRTIIETAHDAFISIDENGAVADWNRQAQVSFGWTKEEVIGKKLSDIIIPERYRQAHKKGLMHFLATGQGAILNRRVELKALHRDGHEFPVELTVWAIQVDHTYHFNAFIHDITERKKAEEKFRGLLESAPDAMVIVDKDGVIILVNSQTEKVFGYDRSELLTKPVETLIPRRFHEAHAGHRTHFFTDPHARPMGAGLELWGVRKDKSEFPVEISLSPLKTEEGIFVTAAVRDITDRRRAEEMITRLNRQRELILNSAAEGIYGLDREGRITFINTAATGMIGYEPKEVIGKNMHSLVHHTRPNGAKYDWKECPQYHVLNDGMVRDAYSEIYWKKDGTGFPVEFTSAPLKEGGEIVGAVVVFRDITYRKLKEDLDLKSQFISTVSHELRTPLTVIKDSVGIVSEGLAGEINVDQKDFLETAKRNVDRLSRLINNVLDFQKLDAEQVVYEKKKEDVNKIIAEVGKSMNPLAKGKGLELILEPADSLPTILMDRDKIIQVLMNLMGNAIKFTDSGSVKLATRQVDNAVEISVKDTGVGIKESDLPKLFKSFSQIDSEIKRKTGGTGLGLVISKKIVEQHGGQIWVESTYGKGSIFYVLLPIEERRRERQVPLAEDGGTSLA